MSSHSQTPHPSISGALPSGKDPPPTPRPGQAHEQPEGADYRDGHTEDDGKDTRERDSKAMPPPPAPINLRRTSYRAAEAGDGTIPQSPGIMVTQPTFEFPSLKNRPGAVGQMSGSGDTSQNQRERDVQQGNPQHSLDFNEGLAGTAGTVRHIGSESAQIQRPNFAPFFTLVHDMGNTNTAEIADGGSASNTFHPSRVHYIFADDEENGILTEALVRSLEASDRLARDPGSGTSDKGKRVEGQKEREERVVIVDMNENGDGIKGVYSANPSWAVLSAEVGNAPTWDGNSSEDGPGERTGGLMLKIEGVGIESGTNTTDASSTNVGLGGDGKQSAAASGTGVSAEEMQTLLDGFDRKMALLRRVVASGDESGRGKSNDNMEAGAGEA